MHTRESTDRTPTPQAQKDLVACLEQLHLAVLGVELALWRVLQPLDLGTARRVLHGVVVPLMALRDALKPLDHAVRRMRVDLLGRAIETGRVLPALVASVLCWGSIGLLLWALCG